jgi:hypothetical protein
VVVVVEPVAPRPSWWHCLVVAIVLVFVAPPHQSGHDRRVVVVVVEPRYRLPLAPRVVALPRRCQCLCRRHCRRLTMPSSSSSGVVVVIERSRRSLLVTIVAVVRRLLLEPKPLRPLARSPVTSLIS